MKRIFTLMVGALAMLTVALLSAFIAMRLAIHGREVEVPALTGLTVADAARLASHDGLNLTLENRFYSPDVPAGRVLAQSPAPGSHVRRDWAVRITESLGAQHVSIPDLTGQSERAATISIRRLSLDQGVVAHLPIAGDPDVVLAQTPAPNAGGVTGPRVSLLVSAPPDSGPAQAYVMPSLVGLTIGTASVEAAAMGLRLAAAAPAPAADAEASGIASAAGGGPSVTAPAAPRSNGTIVAQTPAAGRRVAKGDVVHVALGVVAGAAPAPAPVSPVSAAASIP